MGELQSPRNRPLNAILWQEMRELVCADGGVHNFVFFLLIIALALLVVGRMVYRDLSRDWSPCQEDDDKGRCLAPRFGTNAPHIDAVD